MNQDKITRNINKIRNFINQKLLYNSSELRTLLSELKTQELITKSYTFELFYQKLIELGLTEYTIALDNKYLTKFSLNKDINIYELIITLRKNSFFSMSTALNLQGYSDYRNDFVFVSSELTQKIAVKNQLTQEAIDEAFKKPYRRTHAIGKYQDKNIVFLTPKYTNNYQVISSSLSVSSVHRALVEMVVNVQYFRNSLEIIKVFISLKNKINVNEVFEVLEHFDLIYPYYQCLGYYLERIGFSQEELFRFKDNVSEFKFYTDKGLKEYKFDSYWSMYYLS